MSIFSAALDMLFPPRCAACGRLLSGGTPMRLCPACAARLEYVPDRACKICARPLRQDALLCDDCEEQRPAFRMHISCCIYDDMVRDLMLSFKFHHRPELHRLFADMLIERIRSIPGFPQPDCVVCVPMSADSLQKRGYNQSELIARRVARQLGWHFQTDALQKARDTQTQSTVQKYQRAENVRGAYAVAPGISFAGQRVLVVDDVYTTGSTMNELAGLLLYRGAAEVIAATAAITRYGVE